MKTSDDKGAMGSDPDLGMTEAEVRGVAKRPVRGSLTYFLHDMKTLLNFTALKRAVQEFQRDDALGLGDDLADHCGVAPEGMGPQRGDGSGGFPWREDRDELALVGHVERVDAEHVARASHHRRDR